MYIHVNIFKIYTVCVCIYISGVKISAGDNFFQINALKIFNGRG